MVAGSDARMKSTVSLTMDLRLSRIFSCRVCRLNARICLTRSLARWDAPMMLARVSRDESRAASVSSSISAPPMITPRMLLKSCAIPPASVPSASIFCACRSWASSFSFSWAFRTLSVMSWTTESM